MHGRGICLGANLGYTVTPLPLILGHLQEPDHSFLIGKMKRDADLVGWVWDARQRRVETVLFMVKSVTRRGE